LNSDGATSFQNERILVETSRIVKNNQQMTIVMSTISVMRPKLPSAERVTPYLKKIDSARIYSNYGPLTCSFEARLAAHFGLSDRCVTSVANATLGLTLALMAQNAQPGTLCLMPAWTFIASAHAALMAGLIPYFVDVDAENGALDEKEIENMIARAPGEVGAIMPVFPFGRPIDIAAWDCFRSKVNLPVVIDAAAGFDSIRPGETPAVISLHATKALGIGEGGFVMSTDASIIRNIRARANFGFQDSHRAIAPGTNAKLSEYHAAVGHAALDEWNEARAEWMGVAQACRNELLGSNSVKFQEGFGEDWVSSTCVLHFANSDAALAEHRLKAAGIETRRWWGAGAHEHPVTLAFPRAQLSATERLAQSTLAVPFHRELEPAAIQKIGQTILAATQG
jgi:dTDP-4-amino-4,6-dideoxygalactose transaminase